jgi:hypothetical protein
LKAQAQRPKWLLCFFDLVRLTSHPALPRHNFKKLSFFIERAMENSRNRQDDEQTLNELP